MRSITFMLVLLMASTAWGAAITNPTFTISGVYITDVDIADGDLKLTLTATKGKFSLANTTGLTFATGDGTDDSAMVFTGKLPAVNAALATVIYTANVNSVGIDPFKLVANDQGNTGAGGSKSDSKTINITLPSINMTPVLTIPNPQVVQEDTTTSILGFRIVDGDAGSKPIKVTMLTTNGVFSLRQITGLIFAENGGDGTNDKSMVFTGTVASINTAISRLTYIPDANFNGVDNLVFTVNDLGNTGDGGPKEATGSVRITINAVNDAPEIEGPDSLP